MKIINLKCGYLINPGQIPRDEVCFSWSTENAGNQKAYRLQISHDENFKIIYVDTQKVMSSSNKFIKVKANLSRAVQYYWRVKVYVENGEEEWSAIQSFETKHKGFDAHWIVSIKGKEPAAPSTRFRKDFASEGRISKARLYASAQGCYVAFINGQKCGSEYMAPGWTEYKSRIQYQTYDVTDLINEGKNCLASVVSDGWFMGPLAGWQEDSRCKFGHERAFFAQLEIEYEDGGKKTVISDQSWHSDMKSAYTRCEIYYGADYDSRLEDDFFESGGNSRKNVKIIKQKASLVPSQGLAVKQACEVKPVRILKTPKGETVLDMGQNMVGIPEINVEGRLGQEIELVFFETLDGDGCVYTENLRSARQGLNYILQNGNNVFRPEMTFYGFRYIHVKKWPGDIKKEHIKGIVLASAIEKTGSLKTNNALLNRFIENTFWGQLGNFVDVPTDCPQRDERLGWTGDAQVFIKAAAFNYDVLGFFDKWLTDMTIAQRKDGSIPHVVPDVINDGHCSAGWGEACIIIPWQLYIRYGDIEILSRYYPMMQAFVDYRTKTSTDGHIINSGYHYGDWLALDSIKDLDRCWGETPIDFICTAYYAYAAKLMADIAELLGKASDVIRYKDLYEKIKAAFVKEFMSPSGRLVGNTQTACVLALRFGLLDEAAEKRAVRELVKLIEDYKCITCGFMGSPHILDVLSENGEHDLALKLALKSDYPSWLYPVTMGATTVWEHWDSILTDGSVNPASMNSLNHYAYGAAANWFYEKIAGIVPDVKNPGYRHFFLYPKPSEEINRLECRLKTHYGTIKMYFEMEHKNVRMRINIPDNSTAHLRLENCKAYSLNCFRKKYSGDLLLKSGEYDISYVRGGSILSTVSDV